MHGKKLASLGLALALVYSISLPARAELLKNLKTDGSIETRSFGIDNETDRNSTANDYRGETRTRLMVGGSFDLLDDVHGRILLVKNNRVYGTGGTGNASSEDLNTVQSNVRVDNAYTKIDKVFGHVDLTFGRQFYGDPNDLVIYFGPQNDDILSVTAVDLFRADADLGGWAKFQGIAGKIADTGLTGAGNDTDTDLAGGEVNTDKLIPKGNAAIYYYERQIKNPAGGLGNNTLNVTGLRAAGDTPVAGLGYRAEYIKDFGRNNIGAGAPAYDGNAYDLGVNYGREVNAMPARAHLEWAAGDDQFTAIAPGRRFGIIWGEHTSIAADPSNLNRSNGAPGMGNAGAGVSNLHVLTAGVGVNPIAKLGVDLNWYRFLYAANIANAGVSAGSEWDLILSWKHSDNVYLEVNASTFQVGTSLQNAAPTPTNPIERLGADVKIKF